MKIRNGFVSNSSSSSFIIAIDTTKNKPCECCGRSDPNFLDAVDNASSDGDNDVKGYNYKDTLREISDNTWYDIDAQKLLLKKLKTYDNKKWTVAYVRISYHNDVLKGLLDNMVNSKSAIIIQQWD